MNSMRKERYEKNIASDFLRDCGFSDFKVESLSEFAGRDLRNESPDVIVTVDSHHIGMELTAYSENESENRWRSFMNRTTEYSRKIAGDYLELSGLSIGYRPKLSNEPRMIDAELFARQMLDFVRDWQVPKAIRRGQRLRFPSYLDDYRQGPFPKSPLLRKHVHWVSCGRVSERKEYPVSISLGGFTSCLGLSTEVLTSTIAHKGRKIRRDLTIKMTELWLLIHATGWPISSRIRPIEAGNGALEKLRDCKFAETVRSTGFDRVFLWDGVHHGIADLASGIELRHVECF